MKRTNIYLTEGHASALDRVAEAEGVSRAELIRTLIDRAIGEILAPTLPRTREVMRLPGSMQRFEVWGSSSRSLWGMPRFGGAGLIWLSSPFESAARAALVKAANLALVAALAAGISANWSTIVSMFGSWVIVTAIIIVIVAGVLGLLPGLLLGRGNAEVRYHDGHGLGLPLRLPRADHHRLPAGRQSGLPRPRDYLRAGRLYPSPRPGHGDRPPAGTQKPAPELAPARP